jgi:Predicted integral membrane protein (DUF2269)
MFRPPVIVAEVQFYDVVVWLHVTAVVLAFGPTFAFGIYYGVVGSRDPRSLPAVFDATTVVNRTLTTIGMLVILASGIYLAADRWDFGEAFVIVGIAAIIVLFALVHGFFIPNDRRGKEAAERDIAAAGTGDVEFGAEFWASASRGRTVGALAGLIVILTIYFMAAKPFL